MKFSVKGFFIKCDQIRRKLRIWSHLLKKYFKENFNLCAVFININSTSCVSICQLIQNLLNSLEDTEAATGGVL